MICKKCVLPEKTGIVDINSDGLCSFCQDGRASVKRSSERLLETELTKLLMKYKGKSAYDCLVMCSGGKDSTASLYYVCKRYHLKPLVFTFDNGFEQPGAVENVRRAVDALGADWLYMKSDFMKEMFAEAVRQKVSFPLCALCSLWYMRLTYDIADKYDLPLIFAGWTLGQMTKSDTTRENGDAVFKALCRDLAPFIEQMRMKYPQYADFPKSMDELVRQSRMGRKALIVSPHWFLPFDASEYTAIITKELGWKALEFSYPRGSTNCYLNVLSAHLSLRGHGLTHFHVEMSKLIRLGRLTRAEALEKLTIDPTEEKTAAVFNKVLEGLGCRDVEV